MHEYFQTSQLAVQEEPKLVGPIITQSGPKVQALIIVSSRDRKIKDLAPIALLSAWLAPVDPRCTSLLTVDFSGREASCSSFYQPEASFIFVECTCTVC